MTVPPPTPAEKGTDPSLLCSWEDCRAYATLNGMCAEHYFVRLRQRLAARPPT